MAEMHHSGEPSSHLRMQAINKANRRHRRTKSSSGYELSEWTNNKFDQKNKREDQDHLIGISGLVSNEQTENAINATNNNAEQKNIIIDTLEEYDVNEGKNFIGGLKNTFLSPVNFMLKYKDVGS